MTIVAATAKQQDEHDNKQDERHWMDIPSWDATVCQLLRRDFSRSSLAGVIGTSSHFSQDMIALLRTRPALRGENINVFHVHDQNRVLHRRLKGSGDDVIVVTTFSEINLYDYRIGLAAGGQWSENFNSDVYDNWDWVNPIVAGNGGGVFASSDPLHGVRLFGFPYAAAQQHTRLPR